MLQTVHIAHIDVLPQSWSIHMRYSAALTPRYPAAAASQQLSCQRHALGIRCKNFSFSFLIFHFSCYFFIHIWFYFFVFLCDVRHLRLNLTKLHFNSQRQQAFRLTASDNDAVMDGDSDCVGAGDDNEIGYVCIYMRKDDTNSVSSNGQPIHIS